MSIWKPDNVETEPTIKPIFWRVVDIKGDRHIVCYHFGEGRTSSKIIDWNKETRVATTRSGRKYTLNKDSYGIHSDANYVFYNWKYMNNVFDVDVIEVGDEYL
jgi:hypothetical protein